LKRFEKNGFILVTTLCMMVLLLSSGMVLLSATRSEIEMAGGEMQSLRALTYAESGFEHLMARILNKEITPTGGDNSAWASVDEGGSTDYWADIGWATGVLTSSYMPDPWLTAQKKIKADITNITGMFQAGGNIGWAASSGGTLAGNADAVGTIQSNISNYDTTGYTVTASNGDLNIPYPDMTAYGNAANFTNYYTYTDCTSFTSGPPNGDGIYFISGNCSIDMGSTPFSLDGSMIVSGNFTLQSVTGLTLNAVDGLPVIIATGDFSVIIATGDFSGISLNGINIDGLIYAGNDIILTTWGLGGSATGAFVATNDINLTNVNNATFTFDTSLNPPFFAGGAGGGGDMSTQVLNVTTWQGHDDPP